MSNPNHESDRPQALSENEAESDQQVPIEFRAKRFDNQVMKAIEKNKPGTDASGKKSGKLTRFLKAAGLIMLGGILLLIVAFLIWYISVARTLPDVDNLQSKASQFETARILDREGNLLYEIIDPNAGRRDYVTLNDISPYMVAATIATEDKDFYNHPGFDLIAMFRAVIQNLESGATVSGASTITQQLARNLLLSPEDRYQRSILRKTKEIFLAAEITRRYSKDQILELYLNENNYSNYAYGIEAAANTYFGIPARFLNLAQSAFLAGLPQAPAYYDVFTNYDAAISRQGTVLLLMYLRSKEEKCIYVSNSSGRVCVSEQDVDKAIKEIKSYEFKQAGFTMKYPHWVNFIRTVLEKEYGAQAIYRSGLTVYTSIDPELQELAQGIVSDQISSMAGQNAHNGALVAIRPDNGEILAMVGSPNFDDDENSGQINMATSLRQPGSAIKPFVFAAAFEKGWTPATLTWDVETEFSPTGLEADLAYSPPYVPVNYDRKYHGPVLLREALANSYNVPAVKALEFVHVYDDPDTAEADGFISFAKRFHMDSLDKPGYGLSLALGGGEVTLLELTNAFGVFANNGKYVPFTPILKILNSKDEIIYEASAVKSEQVIREEYAYQITSILSDPLARASMFGQDNVLNQTFPTAVKTGTTNDFRDNWTVGYTPDLVTGVWIGNADYEPMVETTGLSGAAPVWSAFMQSAVLKVSNNNPASFVRPPGVVDVTVCSVSGTLPSEFCPSRKTEIFAYNQLPLAQSEDLWQPVRVNTWNGRLANEFCPENSEQVMTVNIRDPFARRWLVSTQEGINWVTSMKLTEPGRSVYFTPDQVCDQNHTNPTIQFVNLTDGMDLNSDVVEIYTVFNAADGIQSYSLEFGRGEFPQEWFVITNGGERQVYYPEKLADWYLRSIGNGIYTLRLVITSPAGTTAEKRIVVRVNLPEDHPNSEPILVPVYGTDEALPDFFQ